ncbi:hypothetical protein AAK894_12550 [Lachnospiraceae bacterium 46-61]
MELEKMQKVNEILQLCFEINGFEQRQKEKTGEKPTIFAWFSGHTTFLTVMVYEKGYSNNVEVDKDIIIPLCGVYENIKARLDYCIQYLNKLKARESDERLQQAV